MARQIAKRPREKKHLKGWQLSLFGIISFLLGNASGVSVVGALLNLTGLVFILYGTLTGIHNITIKRDIKHRIEKLKEIKLRYIAIACVIVIVSIYSIFRLYAKYNCQQVMTRRSQYIERGEVYVQLKYKDGTPAEFVKRDIFLSKCLAEKFHI